MLDVGRFRSAPFLRVLAGRVHESHVEADLGLNNSDIASKAKHYGVRSVAAVVIDGRLASCCTGRGPDEGILRAALACSCIGPASFRAGPLFGTAVRAGCFSTSERSSNRVGQRVSIVDTAS